MTAILATFAAALNTNLRAGVTYAFTFTVCYGFLTGKIQTTEFMTIAAGVVLFWFGQGRDAKRATDDGQGTPKP